MRLKLNFEKDERQLCLEMRETPCGVFPVVYDKISGQVIAGIKQVVVDKKVDGIITVTMMFMVSEENVAAKPMKKE